MLVPFVRGQVLLLIVEVLASASLVRVVQVLNARRPLALCVPQRKLVRLVSLIVRILRPHRLRVLLP